MSSGPQLRMDGSKPYSTVHGERPPGDPHQHVHFYQDGLPFDASRVLLADMIAEDERLKALAAKKIARQARQKAVTPAASDDDGDKPQDVADDDDEVAAGDDTNLEMWLTGEAKYIFASVRNAIAARYQKRVISIADAVMFLAGEQRIVAADKLAPQFQAFMN